MHSHQTIEELAGLFRQREKIDAQILVLLQLNSEPGPQPEQSQKKKRGRPKGWKSVKPNPVVDDSPVSEDEVIAEIQALIYEGHNTKYIADHLHLDLKWINDLFKQEILKHKPEQDDDYFLKNPQ